MSLLKLFSARACPFAHRTRLVLSHKGLDFELVEIDLAHKPAWFGGVSLYGKVPALEHAGQRFVESAIINEYLDEAFPEPALLPKDPAARALARIWIDFSNTRLAPAFGQFLRGDSESQREAGRRDFEAALDRLEHEASPQLAADGPYFLGAGVSLVDFSLYPWFERLTALEQLRGFDWEKSRPRLAEWRAAVKALPSVRSHANSSAFYVERYRSYAPPHAAAS